MSGDAKKTPFLDPSVSGEGDSAKLTNSNGSPLSSLGKGRSETTDSWGDYVPPDRKSQGGGKDKGKPNPFMRFRSDLEETARRISQRRIDALQVRLVRLTRFAILCLSCIYAVSCFLRTTAELLLTTHSPLLI